MAQENFSYAAFLPRRAAFRCCVALYAGQNPAAANRSTLEFDISDRAARHSAQGSLPLLRLRGHSRDCSAQ